MERFEQFIKEAHKGQKYGAEDYFEYHLKGVAAIAEQKARESHLNPLFAYAIGLAHDVLEDTDVGIALLANEVALIAPPKSFMALGIANEGVAASIVELTRMKRESYYKYIKRLTRPFALLVKQSDLEFHLSQPDASERSSFDKYLFALDMVRAKRGKYSR